MTITNAHPDDPTITSNATRRSGARSWVRINHDPENADDGSHPENLYDRFFYVLADPNYNVMGVVSRLGELAERYEYTPYGQRTVFSHGWFHEDTDDDGDVDSTDVGNVTGYQNTEGTEDGKCQVELLVVRGLPRGVRVDCRSRRVAV